MNEPANRMVQRVMVLLMGDQPAANLIPARRYQPETIVLIHTMRTQTQAARFRRVMPEAEVQPLVVDAYRIDNIAEAIREFVRENEWSAAETVFNLTGGTKMMSLGAYEIAQEMRAPFVYFQSEGGLSRLYRYEFDHQGNAKLVAVEDIAVSISLSDYLNLYLDHYHIGEPRHVLEEVVAEELRAAGLEVATSVYPQLEGGVEIDIVMRLGNQIGVMEIKTKGDKSGIDQVVAVGGQRHLGTYVTRFLVSTAELHPNTRKLADAYRVQLIYLPSLQDGTGRISDADRQVLLDIIQSKLGGQR